MATATELTAKLEELGKKSDELHEKLSALQELPEESPDEAKLSQEIDDLHKEIDRLEEQESRAFRMEDRTFGEVISDGVACKPGEYPWDDWQAWAIEDGIEEKLAQLGRAVIREASQHNWPEKLKGECGWEDDGADMIRIAKHSPDKARIRWEYLLASDGEWHWDDGPRG